MIAAIPHPDLSPVARGPSPLAEAIFKLLVRRLRTKTPSLTYGKLVDLLAKHHPTHRRSPALHAAIGEVCAMCRARELPCLPALVHRADSGHPGPSYFRAAHPRLRRERAQLEAWEGEADRGARSRGPILERRRQRRRSPQPAACPQPAQKRAPAAICAPQPVQNAFAAAPTGLPQPAQNFGVPDRPASVRAAGHAACWARPGRRPRSGPPADFVGDLGAAICHRLRLRARAPRSWSGAQFLHRDPARVPAHLGTHPMTAAAALVELRPDLLDRLRERGVPRRAAQAVLHELVGLAGRGEVAAAEHAAETLRRSSCRHRARSRVTSSDSRCRTCRNGTRTDSPCRCCGRCNCG